VDGDPLINSLMGSFLIEVIGIFPDNSRQLLAIKDECMVQAFSSQAANIPFTNTICARRSIRRSQFFDA
jgi:hypothetical protein